MSVNYLQLEKSKNKLIQKFYNYIDHAIKMHLLIKEVFKDYENNFTNELNQEIIEMEKISNNYQAELLDDSTWIISKDQPQASHLRFIIAIVNSSNDIERICDYANNIRKILLKYFEKKDLIPKFILKLLYDLQTASIDITQKIINYFKENDSFSSYEFTKKEKEVFSETFSKLIYEFKKVNEDHMSLDTYIDITLILKNIERVTDHIFNIIKMFVYIRQSDFLFKKSLR